MIFFPCTFNQDIDICNVFLNYKTAGMYNIIAPSFFQKKNCVLPGVGRLSLVTHSAETDFSNVQIKAPRQEIVFTPAGKGAPVFNEFSAISEMMKRNLDEGGGVDLMGIGHFTKDQSGAIVFTPFSIDVDFSQPVTAERVIHKDAEHNILVGDKETTNVEMTEYFSEEPEAKDRWWIWALVLGATGFGVIAYYIAQHGLNGLSSLF